MKINYWTNYFIRNYIVLKKQMPGWIVSGFYSTGLTLLFQVGSLSII
jgi:hypothetical protein